MDDTYRRSPDYLALLRGVATDPFATLPRLVLADWLEEFAGDAGAPEASLIRSGRGPDGYSARRKSHREWRDTLANCRYPAGVGPKQVSLWRSTVSGRAARGGHLRRGTGTRVEVSDGFVVAFGCCWGTIRRHGAGWCSRNPIQSVLLFNNGFPSDAAFSKLAPHYEDFYGSWHGGPGLSGLPPELYARLDGYDRIETYRPRTGPRQTHKIYLNKPDAYRAADRAALAYCRESAGLPALPADAGAA